MPRHLRQLQDPQAVAAAMEEQIRRQGLTHHEVAERAGVSAGTVAALLAQRRSTVRSNTLPNLSKALWGAEHWNYLDCVDRGDVPTLPQPEEPTVEEACDHDLREQLKKAVQQLDGLASAYGYHVHLESDRDHEQAQR